MEFPVRLPEQPHELVQQLQFPPGYQFVPSEELLVNLYLRAKIERWELPAGRLDVVNEVAVLDWQPGSLVEAYKAYGKNKWYFFTLREASSSNKEGEPNRKVRAPGVKATWKATGSVVVIHAKGNGEAVGEKVVVGTKRVLIYHSSDPEEDGKWSMHEYILEGHGKIGEYALCSIQRKQHSDTVDNAGEGSSRGKRAKVANADPGKAKKRMTNKVASTQPEGVQVQQQETTPVVAPPLKPKSRARRTAPKRKNEGSVQAEDQQHQEIAPVSPAVPPLTQPQQAPSQESQQEHQESLAAHGGWPVLDVAPLQGYPSIPDGMLVGAPAPMHEEDDMSPSIEEQLRSFADNNEAYQSFYQQHGDHSLARTNNQLLYPAERYSPGSIGQNNGSCMRGLDQTHQQEIGGAQYQAYHDNEVVGTDSHAQYEPDQQHGGYNSSGVHDQQPLYPRQYFPGSVTQNNDGWMHGQQQIYHQEIGGAFGAPDQHTDALFYDQPNEHQMQMALGQADYCPSDQFPESVQGDAVAPASDGDMGTAAADDEFVWSLLVLSDVDPQDCVEGTQDGSNPQASQSQDEPRWSCGRQQQQQTVNGPVCDGPPSRVVSDFWSEPSEVLI